MYLLHMLSVHVQLYFEFLFSMSYRSPPEPDKNMIIAAEVAGAFMWWWIFWHCFTDYGHIIVSLK